jgi:AcrR family transcriptional regulator
LRKRLHAVTMETRKIKRVSKMDKEDEILQCAAEEFRKQGLKFTMNDIAKDLHMAKKTIYTFYASKEEMLNAMIDTGYKEIQKNKQDIIASDLPYDEKVKEVMIAMPKQFEVFDFRMLSGLHEKYPKVYKNLQRQLENNWEPVIQLLETGMKEHKIRSISIPVLRQMITASFESFLSTDHLKQEGITYRDACLAMMDIVMNGITEDRDENHR